MSAKSVIDLMVKNEEAFECLYQKFSRIYPNTDFWLELSNEEIHHAQWLKALSQSKDIEMMEIKPLTVVQMKMLGREVLELTNSKDILPLKKVLEKVLHFEESFIEHNYFDIFSEKCPSAHAVMVKLRNESADHAKKVSDYLDDLMKAEGENE